MIDNKIIEFRGNLISKNINKKHRRLKYKETPMKKLFAIFVFAALSQFLPAEKFTLRTGDRFASSLAEYFLPTDISLSGTASVSSIKKAGQNLWCVSIAVSKAQSAPVVFEYYVSEGDIINVRKIGGSNPLEEISLKFVSLDWNKTVVEY